jgi:hypothetical protein
MSEQTLGTQNKTKKVPFLGIAFIRPYIHPDVRSVVTKSNSEV